MRYRTVLIATLYFSPLRDGIAQSGQHASEIARRVDSGCVFSFRRRERGLLSAAVARVQQVGKSRWMSCDFAVGLGTVEAGAADRIVADSDWQPSR